MCLEGLIHNCDLGMVNISMCLEGLIHNCDLGRVKISMCLEGLIHNCDLGRVNISMCLEGLILYMFLFVYVGYFRIYDVVMNVNYIVRFHYVLFFISFFW